jgi:hypothetical protein
MQFIQDFVLMIAKGYMLFIVPLVEANNVPSLWSSTISILKTTYS